MNAELKKYCDLLAENRDILRKVDPMDSDMMRMAAALLYTGRGIRGDAEKIRECRSILKSHAGVFSDFRGMLELVTVCKMTMCAAPERWLSDFEEVYRIVKRNKWMGSERKLLAALTILETKGTAAAEYYADRTNAIYVRMKEEHPWLTSDEDLPFAALLAVSDLPVDALIGETEQTYQLLKPFSDSNTRQSLSHILALKETPSEEKAARLKEIRSILRAEKHRYGDGWATLVLATLVSPDYSPREAADLIMEADDYLKGIRGFGNWSMGSENRRMYAAMLAGLLLGENKSTADSALLGSSIALLIQQQVCAMVAVSCAVSASTAASHS